GSAHIVALRGAQSQSARRGTRWWVLVVSISPPTPHLHSVVLERPHAFPLRARGGQERPHRRVHPRGGGTPCPRHEKTQVHIGTVSRWPVRTGRNRRPGRSRKCVGSRRRSSPEHGPAHPCWSN